MVLVGLGVTSIILLLRVTDVVPDPITALLTRDWAAIGGWSLWIGTVVVIVTGSFREWWVPGKRARRLETLLDDAHDIIKQQTGQITKLTEGNELTQYVISQVAPIPTPRRKSTVAPTEEAVPQ